MMNNQMQYEVRPLVRTEDPVAQIMWRNPVVLPPSSGSMRPLSGYGRWACPMKT